MPQVRPPRFLYKYVDRKGALAVLTNMTFQWTCPTSFNDLFDVQTVRLPPSSAEARREACACLFRRCVLSPDSQSFARPSPMALCVQELRQSPAQERAALVDEFLNSPEWNQIDCDDVWKSQLPSHLLALARTLRVLCLSANGTSAPMWNFYAEEYAGATLCLDTHARADSAWTVAKPMAYSDVPPQLCDVHSFARMSMGLDRLDGAFGKWAYSKHSDWSFEQEWRVVINAGPADDGDHAYRAIVPEELHALNCGPKMPDADVNALREIGSVQCPNMRVHRVAVDPIKGTLELPTA